MFQSIMSRTRNQPSVTSPLIWNEDGPPAENYRRLGERLTATGDLYRSPEYGTGLILVRDNGKPITIEHGKELFPVITDRVVVQVLRDGKPKGGASLLLTLTPCSGRSRSFATSARSTAFPPIPSAWLIGASLALGTTTAATVIESCLLEIRSSLFRRSTRSILSST
jgi:hypothetical protein